MLFLFDDSHISMRSLCSDLLLRAVYFMFMMCLMKYFSSIVGVRLNPYSSVFISNLVSMLSIISISFMKFWVVV